ncbi:hypothetical protein WJX77_010238 [Trebouxia sp. C0004]
MQWIDAIIESGTATSLILEATADRYESGNYHDFVGKLRKAATASKFRLTYGRVQQLLAIFSKGPDAIKLAVLQHSMSCAEVESMLQLSPEAASALTGRSLGDKDTNYYHEVAGCSTSEDE